MDQNRPKKIEIPKLISDDELSQLDDMLPPRAFQQMKEVVLEFQGRLERGELDDIQTFYDALMNRINEADAAYEKVQKMSRNLAKDAPNGYEKLRMQNTFLDRLKQDKEKKEQPPLASFPLKKVAKKDGGRLSPAPPVPPPSEPKPAPPPPVEHKAPEPELEVGIAPDHPVIPEPEPFVAQLADSPIAEPEIGFADMTIKSEPISDVDLTVEAAPLPNKVADEKVKAPIKKTTDKKPKAKKKKAPKETPKKKDKFYKEQKDRIWDYIDKDQKRSSIDIKE